MMIWQGMGAEEMSKTDRKVRDDDPGDPLHTPRESNGSDEPSPVGGEERPGANLETAVDYLKEQTPIKPILSMSCTLCTFEITCLKRKLARKILYNHQRRKHPRDSNNNPE